MLPNTTINTHILSFPSTEGRMDMPITAKKAEAMLQFLASADKQSHFHILDDNGNFKEAIPRSILSRSKIKGVERNEELAGMKWKCDCGRMNPMHIWPADKCDCKGGFSG